MLIAVPAETQSYEKRVAVTPETVKKFIAAGCDLVLEKGAGAAANYSDAAYLEQGARLANDFSSTCGDADLILKVRALNAEELKYVKKGATVASLLMPMPVSPVFAWKWCRVFRAPNPWMCSLLRPILPATNPYCWLWNIINAFSRC